MIDGWDGRRRSGVSSRPGVIPNTRISAQRGTHTTMVLARGISRPLSTMLVASRTSALPSTKIIMRSSISSAGNLPVQADDLEVRRDRLHPRQHRLEILNARADQKALPVWPLLAQQGRGNGGIRQRRDLGRGRSISGCRRAQSGGCLRVNRAGFGRDQ